MIWIIEVDRTEEAAALLQNCQKCQKKKGKKNKTAR